MTDTAEDVVASDGAASAEAEEEVAPAADDPMEPTDPADPTDAPPSARRTLLVVGGLLAIVGIIPAATALFVLRKPHWYPLLDLAQTELRLRDFDNGHAPLLGLASRVHALGKRGSHLGPMQFWAMYPFYKAYGSSAWAFQAAGASVNIVAMGLCIWIGHRRGQLRGALGVAAVLGVLGQAYGAEQLVSEHWIPHTPLMWWIVFLLAVWSVLCDDMPMLPVAVFAGSFCIQTHIPYLGQVMGLAGVTVLVVGISWWRQGQDRAQSERPEGRESERGPSGPAGGQERRTQLRRILGWTGASLGLLLLLWLPPIVEQMTEDPGNLSVMRESLSHPDEDYVGFGSEAIRASFTHLNPWGLFAWDRTDSQATSGSPVPGVLLLAVWAGCVVLAWRERHRALLRAHLVVGLAMLLGYISIARVSGTLFYYLVLWYWGTTALVCATVIWTIAVTLGARWPSGLKRPAPAAATAALLAAVLAGGIGYTWESAHAEMSTPNESYVVSQVAPPTVARLREGDLPGTGEDGIYQVDFGLDAGGIGEQGQGLFLELERQGFDVGVPGHDPGVVVAMVPHRVKERDEVTAVIHYVVGSHIIDQWRDTPGAVEVAYYDPRDAAELREYNRLHGEVVDELQADGLDEFVEPLDSNLLLVALSDETPQRIDRKIQRMMWLGLPAAVFYAPPDVNMSPAG